MGAGNLLRQRETNAAAGCLGCVERNEEIFGVRNAEAAIFLASPASCAAAAVRGMVADPREMLA